MKERVKQIITLCLFLAIIFTMAIMSVLNLTNKYKSSGTPEFTITGFENDFKTNLFLRQEIIEGQGLTQKWIGNNAVEDPETGKIIRNKWGQLTSLPGDKDFSGYAENLSKITDACKAEGITQIYVQAPFKILPSYAKEQLPAGFTTKANSNADMFISQMKNMNVDVYDLRAVLENNTEIPLNELFYKTDHHWTVPTAFYAAGEFAKYLSENFNYCSDKEIELLTDKSNFDFATMDNCYLGSWGRRTGVLYAGVEDFTYITPAFDTDYSIKRVAGDAVYENRGSFYDMVMSPKRVEKDKFGPSEEELAAGFGDNGIYTDLYSVYMDGFVAEMQMVNHNSQNDKKILIFQDSFGFPFSPFMSLTAKETRVIDLRNWHGDIASYISEYEPHFVITLYNPDQ